MVVIQFKMKREKMLVLLLHSMIAVRWKRLTRVGHMLEVAFKLCLV